MVDAKVKDGASKIGSSHGEDAIEKDKAALNLSNAMEEEDDEDEFEDEDEEEEDDEDEFEDEEDEDEDEEEEEPEEMVNDGENVVVVTNTEEKVETIKENTVKKDAKKVEELKSDKKSSENSKSKEKKPTNKSIKRNEKNEDSGTLATNGDKLESSRKKKGSKRVETMGMVFMCSSKTKADCFRYKILGLPESKKDQVLKIYRGMRLFLFDVDLRLMYGIFKAAGPGGYNIEPKAFKSEFPSQVRFSVLDDCLPLAEEMFKSILKENYYSRNKFEGLLKPDQVKKICKLFKEMGRGARPRSAGKSRRTGTLEPRRTRADETRRTRADETRRTRPDDRRTSRAEEKRKRWARDEERRPRSRSPPAREKRRYPEFDRPLVVYDREPPVVYDREPLVPRYHLSKPAVGSPVRLYAYEREPLDIPSYVRDRLPEPHTYRVVDRVVDLDRDYLPEPHAYRGERDRVPDPVTYRVVEREREPYQAYGREPPPPLYREAVYTVPPPEYHLAGREYHHPPAVQAPEYRVSGGSRVASYRDESASDYRSAVGLPEYRSRTHYKY